MTNAVICVIIMDNSLQHVKRVIGMHRILQFHAITSNASSFRPSLAWKTSNFETHAMLWAEGVVLIRWGCCGYSQGCVLTQNRVPSVYNSREEKRAKGFIRTSYQTDGRNPLSASTYSSFLLQTHWRCRHVVQIMKQNSWSFDSTYRYRYTNNSYTI